MALPSGDSQLVQIMDAAWADAARRAGEWLACRPACTQCCYGAFAINALDAARLRAGMEQLAHTDPALAARLLDRARHWLQQHASAFPGDPETGLLDTSDAAQEAFENYANDDACPALDPATGRCDVYAFRPMTCRVFGPPIRMEGDALGCCELCFHGATDDQIAACELHVPHALEEELLRDIGASSETLVAFALLQSAPSPAR